MKVYIEDNIETIDEEAVARLIDKLPEWRKEVALRFKHVAGRRESAMAYDLLCRALSEQYAISTQPHFLIGEHGKPTLAEHPHIHFSLSHCRTAILCAIADSPIGADIERCRPIKDTLLRHTMNEEEIGQIINSHNPELAFAKLWTAKEAVVKLSGRGLQGNIPDILNNMEEKNIFIQSIINKEKDYAYSIATYKDTLHNI